jgi:hypothetical protein
MDDQLYYFDVVKRARPACKKTASWAPAGACIVFVGWRKKAY